MTKHIRGLDGIRAIAVTAVVWHHTHAPIPGLPLSGHGFLGVDMFFALSGFLITTLLLDEERRHGGISLKQFYIRRSLRIFPLYYAVLAFMSVYFLVAPNSTQRAPFFNELLSYATYTSNFFHLNSSMAITWSLSTEEQFYLVWPPLLAVLGRRAVWPLVAFLVLNQIQNFGYGIEASIPVLQTTFTPIILGVLLAFGMERHRAALARIPSAVLIALLLLIASWPGDIQGAPRLAFHIVSTLLIGSIVTRPESLTVRLLEWRPIVFVGTISYGVYLLHKLVLDVAVRLLHKFGSTSDMLTFLLCFAGTLCLAALSYRYFESPLLRLKRRFGGAEAALVPAPEPTSPAALR